MIKLELKFYTLSCTHIQNETILRNLKYYRRKFIEIVYIAAKNPTYVKFGH